MDFQESIKHYARVMKVSESEARGDAERTISAYMKNEGYTREFAESTWIEDCEDLDADELDEMERKAKATGAAKVKAKREPTEDKPKQVRERKPNYEKLEIINKLNYCISEWDMYGENFAQTVEVVKPEREITFKIGENCYSLVLTCHRKPKNG